jgi:hypothetical protein
MTPLYTEVVSRAPGLLVQRQTARFGPIGMEQLWNRGGATGGKSSGRQKPENRLNWRQTVADGCHRLPFGSHGKQGVCRGLPAVAEGPLPEKEEVDLRAPQNAKSWEAEGRRT